MGKNVLIPLPLVKQIFELLGYFDLSEYDSAIRDDCAAVLQALFVKTQQLDLRDAYAKIITADGEDSRHDARIAYLAQKAQLYNIPTDVRIL